jgi:hypothetical protein
MPYFRARSDRIDCREVGLVKEWAVQLLGTLAFGAMTLVNLIVLALVVVGTFRRTRVHH